MPNNQSSPDVLVRLTSELMRWIYWTVLTDLGQSALNELVDPQRLMDRFVASREFICSFVSESHPLYSNSLPYGSIGDTGYVSEAVEWYLGCSEVPENITDNITSFYQAIKVSIPQPRPAVFAQEYTCEVPKMKAAGGLIISILVADLVFLQALWHILNWLTVMVMTRRNVRANYCDGCEMLLRRDQEEGGGPVRTNTDHVCDEEAHESKERQNEESSCLMGSAEYNTDRNGDGSIKHGPAVLTKQLMAE